MASPSLTWRTGASSPLRTWWQLFRQASWVGSFNTLRSLQASALLLQELSCQLPAPADGWGVILGSAGIRIAADADRNISSRCKDHAGGTRNWHRWGGPADRHSSSGGLPDIDIIAQMKVSGCTYACMHENLELFWAEAGCGR